VLLAQYSTKNRIYFLARQSQVIYNVMRYHIPGRIQK